MFYKHLMFMCYCLYLDFYFILFKDILFQFLEESFKLMF